MGTDTTRNDNPADLQLRQNVDGLATWCEALELVAHHGTVTDTIDDEDWLTEPEAADVLEELREWVEDGLGDEDALGILNTHALHVKYLGSRFAGDEWQVEGVEICTGTGGPHIEVMIDEHGRTELRGYWSSSRIERPGPAMEAIVDMLTEYAEL